MFSPGEKVKRALEESGFSGRYTVLNARFINSLGGCERHDYNAPLSPEMQERLIDAVLEKMAECEKESDAPAVVYSDDIRFLKEAEKRGFRICDTNGIGHMSNPEAGERTYLMTFANIYIMSRAERIYSIRELEGFPKNSLYKTQYPRYAAILGDVPFIKVEGPEKKTEKT